MKRIFQEIHYLIQRIYFSFVFLNNKCIIHLGNNAYEKCSGFNAAAGWDPVTGLGTPLYTEMLTAAFDHLLISFIIDV